MTTTIPTRIEVSAGLPAASLIQLIWLASPALPIGGFSYSEGLEAAVDRAGVTTEAAAADWLADQLHLAGLINRLVPAGEALDAARDLAAQISKNAPLALAATKRVIVESLDWPASEAFARQGLIAGPVFGSADAMEGALAFGEKRPPVWRGE